MNATDSQIVVNDVSLISSDDIDDAAAIGEMSKTKDGVKPRNAQSRSLLSRLNGEDQLAAGVAANSALESLARLSERDHGRHDWLDDAAIDQFFNLDEFLPAWFDEERHAAHAIFGSPRFRNFAGRRHDDPAVSDDWPRALQRVAPDRI